MTRALFVGVDSGGTRTNVLVYERPDGGGDPQPSASYESVDTLSGSLRLELIPETIRKILAPLNSRVTLGEGSELYVWLSAAGFAGPVRETYLAAMSVVASAVSTTRVVAAGAANDAVSGLLGHPEADGIVVAGTGSNVILQQDNGDMVQYGGEDWVASDDGAGFWIGLRGIRSAFRDFESGANTTILQRFYQEYSIEPGDRGSVQSTVRSLAIGDRDMKADIARFAAEVCGAAQRGDIEAQNIVASEAEGLADVTAAALRRTFSGDRVRNGLTLVQCGAVLGNEFYRSRFEKQLGDRMRGLADIDGGLKFIRVETLAEAAVRLAQGLSEDTENHLGLDREHRPVVLRLE